MVVGDVIVIEAGMRVPADCIMFEGLDVVVDESMYHEGREHLAKKQLLS